jgi:hypothetical protein
MLGGNLLFNRRRGFAFLGVHNRREQQSSVTDDRNAFHGGKARKLNSPVKNEDARFQIASGLLATF